MFLAEEGGREGGWVGGEEIRGGGIGRSDRYAEKKVDIWMFQKAGFVSTSLLTLPVPPSFPPYPLPLVQIPRDLFKPEGYSHKEALFGIPVYG